MDYFTEIAPEFRLPDQVWERLHGVLPQPVPKPKGGRPRMPDRQALDAIVYVLRRGCQWNALPRCLGASSTVHDRFQEWVQAGVFFRLWEEGLKQYAKEVGIEWAWNSMDGAMVKAPLWGKRNGSQPNGPREIGD
jgi:transposase